MYYYITVFNQQKTNYQIQTFGIYQQVDLCLLETSEHDQKTDLKKKNESRIILVKTI